MNICNSGAADGADTCWGIIALREGHGLRHFTAVGLKGSKSNPHRVVLTDEQLLEADPWLIKANAILKRTFPTTSDNTNKLLRRNYHQVKDASSVYAVAGINENTVYGGTAWAVEMFKIINPNSDQIYIFDEKQNQWFQWAYIGWKKINRPPSPNGIWAGIGSRVIEYPTIEIMREVFSKP